MRKYPLPVRLPVKTTPAAVVPRFLPAFASCCLLGLFAGCASEPESHLVSAPPPPAPTNTVVTTTTTTPVVMATQGYVTTAAAAPAVSTIIVTQAPPGMQAEVVLAQPSSSHVWIAGFWTWRHERYEWMAGQWVLPPNANAVWVKPRWEQQGNAYRFSEGYWN